MTDLDKLIDAVECGAAPLDAIAKMKLLGLPSVINNNLHEASSAYRGSLDAAKALHEALLPGWWVQHIGHNLAGWGVRLETRGVSLPESCLLPRSDDPARAWLIATLKAYRSKHED